MAASDRAVVELTAVEQIADVLREALGDDAVEVTSIHADTMGLTVSVRVAGEIKRVAVGVCPFVGTPPLPPRVEYAQTGAVLPRTCQLGICPHPEHHLRS